MAGAGDTGDAGVERLVQDHSGIGEGGGRKRARQNGEKSDDGSERLFNDK